MSKTWKWILGILLVLLVVGAFFAVGFAWRTHTTVFAQARVMPLDRNWNGPMMGRDNDKWNHPQIWQRDNGWQHPMMNSRGMGGGFFMLGGLAKLALFFGLLYGAYWLGRRNARITLDPAPAASVMDASAAPEAESPPAPRKRAKKISEQ